MERSRHVFPWVVLALVCVGASIRISVALSAPAFSEYDPVGLFRSDPALLYYVTERLIDNGGWPPEDFRADPRIEHPETTDIPAMFTVGEEFLVAWAYLLFGRDAPLHLFILVLMGVIASTAVVGIVGLTRELTGSRAWACLAGLVYVVTPGSYRTIGFMLLREDLSLPLFALHLYLAARALRVRSAGAIAAAALAAVAALATWHAMSFIFTVEVACVFAWYLRAGENPMGEKSSWVALVVLAAGGLLVPVLLDKAFILSIPVQLLCVMAVMLFLQRRSGEGPLRRAMIGLAVLAVISGLSAAAKGWLAPGSGDYAHVLEMMIAKVRYLGERPDDPSAISHGTRLLWTGIFATSSPRALLSWLGPLAFLTPVCGLVQLDAWWRGRGDGRAATLAAFGVVALVLALMVSRLFALAAILSPPLAVILLRSTVSDGSRRHWGAALVLVQGLLIPTMVNPKMLDHWYSPIVLPQLTATLHYIQDELPDQGAIATDYVVSAAVLARTSHRSVLQPKYETSRSRDRIERFITALYHTSSSEFHEILRREFDARYLLVNVPFMLHSRYEAGIRADASPPPGSAASRLLAMDRSIYGTIPGYRYQSHPRAPRLRLYDLVDGEGVRPPVSRQRNSD